MNTPNTPSSGGDLDFLGSDFSPENNQSTGGGTPFPAGEYDFNIAAAEVKTTKRGDGRYIEFELVVANGPHTGRKCWDRINVANPSADAQEIGRENFADACLSAGTSGRGNVAEMVGRTLRASVKIERSEEHGDSNRVKWYVKEGPKGDPGPGSPLPAASPNANGGGTPAPSGPAQPFNDADLPF